MRKTKIVCTIGPASEDVSTLEKLMKSGMNVSRLNFSHGNHLEHAARIKNIRKAAERTGLNIAILLDTKGPEIRTGSFKDGKIELKKGKKVFITMDEVEGTEERFSVSYPDLIQDVKIGNKILLDDGLIELEIMNINLQKNEIETKILNSGELTNRKGVNVPYVKVSLPGITEKDKEDILFGIEQNVDFIAASFVRRPSDVFDIRTLLEEKNATHINIIPKIENQEGVNNIDMILEASDGIMVARGDLGVEIPAEEVPLVQKDLIQKCNIVGKPVIIATQMLDSMERNPRPTRAEASDVANAIFDGTDAVMLSGETAAGEYPVESVQMMHNIALKAETRLDNVFILKKRSKTVDLTITDAISQSVTHTAMNLNVDAIVTPTESGHTARMISKYRPNIPIIAVTFSKRILRQLALVWGVSPAIGRNAYSTDDMLDTAVEVSLASGIIDRGDKIIITAGVPVGESGTTNLMKVHVVGNVITKGQGLGRKTAYGRTVIAKTVKDANDRVEKGDILVTIGTEKDMMPAIERASGIIAVEGGLTSHTAVVGLSLGIPVIVGVEHALELLTEGEEITIDGTNGDIYKGHANVL